MPIVADPQTGPMTCRSAYLQGLGKLHEMMLHGWSLLIDNLPTFAECLCTAK